MSETSFKGRLVYLIPLVVVLAVGVASIVQLRSPTKPNTLPSVLINREVPPFDLAPLEGYTKGFSSTDLIGQVSLVNIFGSWCIACVAEHGFLVKIKNVVPIYGIDWREKTRSAGPDWLAKRGDPYTLVGDDPDSEASIAFGVTGAPETFIVDKAGVIRYKHIGPVDQTVWDDTLWPLIQELRK